MPRRAAILFSGGPAPAANAVIAATATTLRRAGWEVLGIRHGYRALERYDRDTAPLVEGKDYFVFADRDLWGLRHRGGILIGTARAHPGRSVRNAEDLDDPVRTERLRRTWQGLVDLGVEALVSIGGDGTLITADLFRRWQDRRPEGAPRVRVVHVPKTIDNDYGGIDFTFGFFTAVEVYATELRNLREDARATDRYYVAECMGRQAGWLAYGAAVAGEAHMVVGREDVLGSLALGGHDPPRLDLDALVDRVVELVLARRAKGKGYGVVVLAEGLAELLPESFLEGLPRGEHGELSLARLQIGRIVAERAEARFKAREGTEQRIVGVQLGYEARCAPAHAFDILLGSQLGVGAARVIAEGDRDGIMVSIEGQLSLRYVPFDTLVDPSSLRTEVRFVPHGSDFHQLAHGLQTVLPSDGG